MVMWMLHLLRSLGLLTRAIHNCRAAADDDALGIWNEQAGVEVLCTSLCTTQLSFRACDYELFGHCKDRIVEHLAKFTYR